LLVSEKLWHDVKHHLNELTSYFCDKNCFYLQLLNYCFFNKIEKCSTAIVSAPYYTAELKISLLVTLK